MTLGLAWPKRFEIVTICVVLDHLPSVRCISGVRFISSPSGPRSSRRRRSSALSYLILDAAREGESVKPAQVNQTLISGAVDVAEGLLLAAMCHDISNQSEVICVGHGFSPVRGLPPPRGTHLLQRGALDIVRNVSWPRRHYFLYLPSRPQCWSLRCASAVRG